MRLFTIDLEKCQSDGICVAVCPLRIIELGDGGVPTPVADAEERCIKCGHCVAVCPTGAFAHTQLRNEDFVPLRKELALTAEQAEQFLRTRRSIRVYRDQSVEKATLARLIDLARYSPTGTNSQQVQWLVINSRERVHKLAALVIEMIRGMVRDGHPLAVKYHLERSVNAWESGLDTITRGAPALVIAHAPKEYGLAQVDCTSALAYLDLAAPTLGLGCCWAGFLMVAAAMSPPFQQALALPEGLVCCGIMMAGYPKFRYHRLPPRNEAVVTWRD